MNRMRTVHASLSLAGLVSIGLLLGIEAIGASPAARSYFVYVGTYTRSTSKGIYAYRFQPSTGTLTPLGTVAETPNPSFVAAHPSGKYLYAVNEHEEGEAPGKNNAVSAFSINPKSGQLTFLNKVSSQGEGPCHVSVDKTGKTLLVANFRSGSVAALPIGRDGRLGEVIGFDQHHGSSMNPVRQKGPHAHMIIPSPDNRFALNADLGVDKVYVYKLDAAKSQLTPNDPPSAGVKPGSGPRHLTFHPGGKYVYLINETASTITAFSYDAAKGTLQEFQTVSTLPADFSGTSTTAEIQVDPTGRFLYGSNRGHDSIAVFAINPKDGTLTLVEHIPTQGRTPRYFAFDPSGHYVFLGNQESDTIFLLRADAKTGHLTPAAPPFTDVPMPVSFAFVPAGR
jgi:6-phosphogluconolactonase